jgi:chromosome segregation protein
MEDVIFGGTQMRKQTGYAEVSLVLDNSDGIFNLEETEVMITRRYYRSGESEYYINRRSCRLRDVNELLMDTGLGREGYSIIGQGRIDEILSVKSQDRREIFEEAAGISKFRHRKEESERRLERTEENLVRINDKISELELQVEPLREQAEKAKKYLLLRDELRGLEISLWMEQLDRIRAGNSKLLSDYAQAVRQRDEVSAQQENLYAKAEELLEQTRQKDVQAEELRERRRQEEAQQAQRDSRAAVLRSQMASNQENVQRIQVELGDQQGREDSITQQISDGRQRLSQISGEKAEMDRQMVEAVGEAAGLNRKVEQMADALNRTRQQEAQETASAGDAKALLSALAAASQELLDRDAALRATLQETQEQLTQAKEQMETNEKKRQTQREQKTETLNRLSAWKLKAQTRQQKGKELADRVSRLSMEDNNLRSRVKMLSEMEKVYEGYSKAVKVVMSEAKRGTLTQIRGPVAGLIRVPDEYTVAIEIALGGAMQHIVVENEEAGKRAINWLKRRDAGRATFLPLSVIRGNLLQERGVENEPGFVGIASQLVSYEGDYQNLFTNLLGRVVVAENMDAAIAIANRYRHRFRIVTLDGQVLNVGGSMTGGSVSRSAGILSRANELKRLRQQGEQLQQELAQAKEEQSKAQRETDQLNYQINVTNEELRQIEDAILRLDGQAEHYRILMADLEARAAATQKELGLLGSRSGQNEEEIDKARARIREMEESAAAIRAEGDQLSAQHTQLLQQAQEVSQQIAKLKLDAAALTAEEEATGKTLEQLRQLQTDLSGDRETRIRNLEALKDRNRQLEVDLQQEEELLKALLSRKTQIEEQLQQVNSEKLALEAQRSRIDRESRDKNNELLAMEREVSALEQKKAAATAEENQLLDKLWENYELSHSAAQQVRFQLESVQKAARRISELKRGISGLGNVNVGAVEEFDRVNGRYTYLIEQRDDVTKSKAELLTIIDGITSEMEEIFREQFKRIQESFATTFLELFGGGKAALELEDESDILNCGIEIKVQPPGKSLKIISLLSGGEKAFVAIALYFAILKVRPTPFVVMDEIEAALDDNNVVRFAHYMRSMTAKTQFIVITHRRGTMEEADVLYGVTMQEQGISRMLTINLNDVEKELHLTAH